MRRALLAALLAGIAACGAQRQQPAPPAPPSRTVTIAPETTTVELTQRRTVGRLNQAERDSLLREVEARRSQWRARGVSDYLIQIQVGCFCPWSQAPAVLEVRGGEPVALRDTAGKALGAPREPWSLYTVEALFDAVVRGARDKDVIEVGYDPTYGYPGYVGGDSEIGLPDDWFWVKASRLTPLR